MPILSCPYCKVESEFTISEDGDYICGNCGVSIPADEFRQYRRNLMLQLLKDEALSHAKNWLDELFEELQTMVDSNPNLAAEIATRQQKELEKFVRLAQKGRKRRAILGVYAQ